MKNISSKKYRLPNFLLNSFGVGSNFALAFGTSESTDIVELYLGDTHYIHFGNSSLMLVPLAGVSRICGFPHCKANSKKHGACHPLL